MPRRNSKSRQPKAPWFVARFGNKPSAKLRKRVRPVSTKRARERLLYSAKRKRFLKEHPFCAVYPRKHATQVHHVAGRKSSNYLDDSTWLAVSMEGHERIHHVLPGLINLSGPAWATRMGYLKSFHA